MTKQQDRSHLTYIKIPVTPYQQNCTILYDEDTKEAAIIDPGGELDRLETEISKRDLKVQSIWITHGHLDHAGATRSAAKRWGVPIEGPHADDQFWIEMLPVQAQMFGMGEAESFVPDRWLHDGDHVQLGRHIFQVIHCPGHTPGHVVFFNQEYRLAFVGDVLFRGSIGRTDFPKGNHQDLLNSIRQKLFPLGNDVEFVCGHGPNSHFGVERTSNPFVGDHVTD